MKIFPLSEGIFTIGHDKIMIPFDPAEDQLNERPVGSLLVEIQPFLIQTARHLILLDSGLGFRGKSGEWQIFENIREAGFCPEQVTHVIQSHLHKDHSGGLCFENELGIKSPAFPNARYFISALEFDEGIRKGMPSYHPEDFDILRHAPQTEWLGEKGHIDADIRYETLGGHCPFHIAIWIQEGHETIFFGGDIAPQLKQLKTKYVAKYDYDGQRAMELRQQFAQQGKEENWTFLFY
ncbi:MAG TPA: MBL fold metallo-hydrolase, partial [Chitinophagaceae bacterium]|nr:MBL fold metallo-hydrolase [Chitinophagaceae bacterium]